MTAYFPCSTTAHTDPLCRTRGLLAQKGSLDTTTKGCLGWRYLIPRAILHITALSTPQQARCSHTEHWSSPNSKKQSFSLFRCSGLLWAEKVVLRDLLLPDLCSLSTLITIFNLHKQHYLLPCMFAQCIINRTRLCSSSAAGCSTCCTQLAMQLFPLHLSHPEKDRGQREGLGLVLKALPGPAAPCFCSHLWQC